MHGYRVALDFVPADAQGGIHYEDAARIQQIAHLAKSQGWVSGFDFPGFQDRVHIQYVEGHSIDYFRNGGKI